MTLFSTPTDNDYETTRAEMSFILDLQLAIEAEMECGGHTQAGLAKLLDVSPARVSQMLSGNGSNLGARSIARIAHKLGKRAKVEFVAAGAPEKSAPVSMHEWSRRTAASANDWGRLVIANSSVWEEQDDMVAIA